MNEHPRDPNTDAPLDDAAFAELVTRYFDGLADDADLAALNDALRTDPARRDQLVWMGYESRLLLRRRRALGAPVLAGRVTPSVDRRRPVRPRWMAGVALAAALLLAGIAAAVYLAVAGDSPSVAPERRAAADVAVVTGAHRPVYTTALLNEGDGVAPGEIALTGGSVDLNFLSGTTATLTGPAELTAIAQDRVALRRGHLRVDARPGFVVELPRGGRVVDLGTRFHVFVDPDRAEVGVHVVDGRVRIDSADGSQQVIGLGATVRVADGVIGEPSDRLAERTRRGIDRVYIDEPFDLPLGAEPTDRRGWQREQRGGHVRRAPDGLTHPALESAGGALTLMGSDLEFVLDEPLGRHDQTLWLSVVMQSPDVHAGADRGALFRVIALCEGDARHYAAGLLRNDGDRASAAFEHRAYAQTAGDTPDLGEHTPEPVLILLKLTYADDAESLTIDGWLNPTASTDLTRPSHRIELDGRAFAFDTVRLTSAAEQGADVAPATFDAVRLANFPPTLRAAAPSAPVALPTDQE